MRVSAVANISPLNPARPSRSFLYAPRCDASWTHAVAFTATVSGSRAEERKAEVTKLDRSAQRSTTTTAASIPPQQDAGYLQQPVDLNVVRLPRRRFRFNGWHLVREVFEPQLKVRHFDSVLSVGECSNRCRVD